MYYILFTKKDGSNVWELVDGHDAMQERVYELCQTLGLAPEDIVVFSADAELV